jgi:hypothetical protein
VKVQLFEHGVFSIDISNPDCTNEYFLDTKIFSTYDDNNGKRILFKEANELGWTGYFAIKEDPTIRSDIELDVLMWSEPSNEFAINMIVPSCVAPSANPSPAPSISPSLSCANDHSFRFEIVWGLHRSCDWLHNNQVRQHRYCDKTNADGVAISIACAKSCNNCLCKDDLSFRFALLGSGESKSCEWLKGNYLRQQKYCQRECDDGEYAFIGSACSESCRWCPVVSVSPSTVPTLTPTKSIVICNNDDHFRFQNEFGHNRSCDWLVGNTFLKQKYCDKTNVNGMEIGVACAQACAECCGDDLKFIFLTEHGESRSCDWLKDDYYRQQTYCPRECDEYPFIGNACPDSCNWCPKERKS